MPYKAPEKERARIRAKYKRPRTAYLASGRVYDQTHKSERIVIAEKDKPKRIAIVRKNKIDVFNAYGGAMCACCGETHIEFLSLDHIGGDGAAHRRQLAGKGLYLWLKTNGYPSGFRVLCMNCNFALGKYGYCPHGNVRIESDRAITKNGQCGLLTLE